MTGAVDQKKRLAITEPTWLRLLLTVMALIFLLLIVILPLVAVFADSAAPSNRTAPALSR